LPKPPTKKQAKKGVKKKQKSIDNQTSIGEAVKWFGGSKTADRRCDEGTLEASVNSYLTGQGDPKKPTEKKTRRDLSQKKKKKTLMDYKKRKEGRGRWVFGVADGPWFTRKGVSLRRQQSCRARLGKMAR